MFEKCRISNIEAAAAPLNPAPTCKMSGMAMSTSRARARTSIMRKARNRSKARLWPWGSTSPVPTFVHVNLQVRVWLGSDDQESLFFSYASMLPRCGAPSVCIIVRSTATVPAAATGTDPASIPSSGR